MSQLLLVGSSVRAAAQSAHRAGFACFAVDQFGDTDLAACCRTLRLRGFCPKLMDLVAHFPACPFLYTGPLENHPEIVEGLSQVRPLWGNPASVLRQVRDPWRVQASLVREKILVPQLREWTGEVPAGEWICKSYRSGGGRGVIGLSGIATREAKCVPMAGSGTVLPPPGVTKTHYLQQRISGTPYSGAYLAAGNRAQLLAVTRQLVGVPWTGARDFWYAGSLGPVALDPDLQDPFQRVGACLARDFSLRGLFGVDAMVNSRGVWPIEVNPRYTASLEIIERQWGVSLVEWHAAACLEARLRESAKREANGLWGKAILYARRAICIEKGFLEFVEHTNRGEAWPLMADIPAAGERIAARSPIVTVFARGQSMGVVRDKLRRRCASIDRVLGNR